MSTTTDLGARRPGAAGPAPAVEHDVHSEPVSVGRVIASEWIKFRTLRSTVAVLCGALLAMLVIAAVIAYNTRHLSSNLQPNDIVASSPLQGYFLGQLLIGALGVLFVTGEYSTGMIRATLVAVPKRIPVLWAKLVVFAGIATATLVPVTIIAFLMSQAILSKYRTGFSFTDAGVPRVVIGTAFYLVLVGTIAGALGWIVRSTPGALVAYIAVMLVLPVLFADALGSWGRHVAEYFPSNAGGAFIQSIPEQPSLSPWTGLLVLLIWTVAAVAGAAVVLKRHDA